MQRGLDVGSVRKVAGVKSDPRKGGESDSARVVGLAPAGGVGEAR